jgi:iron complex outermembrane receptor protein
LRPNASLIVASQYHSGSSPAAVWRRVLWLTLLPAVVFAEAQPPNWLTSPQELKRLSLEELVSLRVTSVSRRPESASRAAAAVEVIPEEQIERTGATSVPDALRLATGLQVSRFGGHSFAVGTRGFTSLTANKLQVMQDGRSLYSPLYSGVFWDAYGIMLEDIDRIEVIRGPGATMWGANAMNGVISIISKDARDTQGTLVTGGGGTEERGFGAVRYGGKLGDQTYFRVYGRYQNRGPMALPDGSDARDSSQEGQGGFRMDSSLGDQNQLTLQGDYLYNDFDLFSGALAVNRSANLLGRFTRQVGVESELQFQTYYDRFERNVPGQFGELRHTVDADVQFRTGLWQRHAIIAGLDYRVSTDDTRRGGTIEFEPAGRTIHIFSGFLQDEISLVPERLALVIGSKLEWNSLDGVQPQPSARLAWTPTEHQMLWTAFSRPVRMPSRIDEDLRFIPNPTLGLVFVEGNPGFKPEKAYAYELGYRIQPHRRVSVDLASYYNKYQDLRSLEPSPPLGIPLVQYNRLEAETYGVECSLKYQPAPWCRLSGNYTYLHKNLLPDADSRDPNRGALEGNDAPHLFSVWASFDLPRRITFDAVLRYVAELPAPVVPAYLELDLRLAWQPTDYLEVALVGQNLLDSQHREFGGVSPAAPEVQRGVYGKLTWRF